MRGMDLWEPKSLHRIVVRHGIVKILGRLPDLGHSPNDIDPLHSLCSLEAIDEGEHKLFGLNGGQPGPGEKTRELQVRVICQSVITKLFPEILFSINPGRYARPVNLGYFEGEPALRDTESLLKNRTAWRVASLACRSFWVLIV